MGSHPEMPSSYLTPSSSAFQTTEDLVPVEGETSRSMGFDGTPSLADSFSSAESDPLPAMPKKIKSMTPSCRLVHPISKPLTAN